MSHLSSGYKEVHKIQCVNGHGSAISPAAVLLLPRKLRGLAVFFRDTKEANLYEIMTWQETTGLQNVHDQAL